MAKIFGGKSAKSQSTSNSLTENLAFGDLKAGFLPGGTSSFQAGNDALQQELAGGYEGYKRNTGFDFWRDLGLKKTAGGFSGRGMFNSGATQKALQAYGSNLATANYNDYLQQQLGLAGLGIQAGQLVSGAGNRTEAKSQSTSKEKEYAGFGKFIGQIIGTAAAGSDIRLKTDITRVGDYGDIGLYEYTYISGQGPYVGVMAQEVAEKYPEALGPERAGYLTVYYNKLEELING